MHKYHKHGTMKKRSEVTQTLHAGCSKAEPKISPRHRPLPGGVGQPKFNQLEMVTSFTYKPSLVRIDARNFELCNWPTHPHTHKQTHRTDYISLRCSFTSMQCNKNEYQYQS